LSPTGRLALWAFGSVSVPFMMYTAMRLIEIGHFIFTSLKPLTMAILKYVLHN